MPKLKTEDYTRIALLANRTIADWWERNKDNPERQELLRQAIQIGLNVLEGRLATIQPDQAEIYKAIETLLRSGVIPSTQANFTNTAPEEKKEQQPTGAKKPKIGKVRESISAQRK